MSDRYPLFKSSGSPRELARAHGEQAAEKIRGFLEFLKTALRLSTDSLARRALRFQSLFEEFCPRLLEEIAGLAEGAAISRPEALALQLRGELAQIAEEACTSFVIAPHGTAAGETLIGQTSDTPAEIEDFAYVLHLVPDDRPEIIMWTFGGMLGYHGLNRRGVAHFANALGGGPAWKFALSHYPLKRLMLECRDLDEVIALLDRVPVASNGNYVLCDDAGRIADVELTSAGPNLIDDGGAGFIVHSNHFLCAPYACTENFERSLPDSFPRLERMRRLVAEKFGSITVADVQTFLADHNGYPVGICRHPHEGAGDAILPNTGKTVAALIAEPARGLLHVARGNPCVSAFETYAMAAERVVGI
jgi:isopenicillin-N N-acyltransferase-like protein